MPDEGTSVNGARAEPSEGLDMLRCAVSLVPGETVLRIRFVQLPHFPVPRNLRDDACRGYGVGQSIPFDNRNLPSCEPEISDRVDQKHVRRNLLRRPAHRGLCSLEDVNPVDFLRAGSSDAHEKRVSHDFPEDLFPPGLAELFAVVHPDQQRFPRHDHAGGHHVAGQRASAGFVHAGDRSEFPPPVVKGSQGLRPVRPVRTRHRFPSFPASPA